MLCWYARLNAIAGPSALRKPSSSATAQELHRRYSCLSTHHSALCYRSLSRTYQLSVRSLSSTSAAAESADTAANGSPPWLFSTKDRAAPTSSPRGQKRAHKTAEPSPRPATSRDRQRSDATKAVHAGFRPQDSGSVAEVSPAQDFDADADRRQRSLETTASTSAASTTAAQQPSQSPAARVANAQQRSGRAAATQAVQPPKPDFSSSLQNSQAAAPSEEQSQYAQKASSQHSKLGTKPIRDLLESKSITLADYSPGQKRAQCPKCAGGSTHEDSLALHISDDSQSAKWICHRATCGWEGGIDQASGSIAIYPVSS